MMVMFSMNEHEYFKIIEEHCIIQIYRCDFCYVINLDYKIPNRRNNQKWIVD